MRHGHADQGSSRPGAGPDDLRIVVRLRRTSTYGLHVLLGAIDQERPPGRWVVRLASSEDAAVDEITAGLAGAERVLVAWSFMTPDAPAVAAEVARVRRAAADPDHRVTHLAGGPHAGAEPLATLGLGFDLVAIGEGEATAVGLVGALASGTPVGEVPGLAWLDGEAVLATSGPAPRHPLDRYPPWAARWRRYNPIEITRGCIYACRFCQTPYLFKARFRHRSVDDVAAHVEHLRRAGSGRYMRFVTPTALSYGATGPEPDLGAVEALLVATRRALGPDGQVYFGTFPSECRPEHVTPEAMRLLARHADNRSIAIGAQSGSEAVLASAKRGHGVEEVERAVRTAVAHGFRPDVDLLFGLPGEQEADVAASLTLAERLTDLGARIHGHTFMPLPGTPYRHADPGRVMARAELERLAARGRLYGQWARQEAIAAQLVPPPPPLSSPPPPAPTGGP